MDQQQPIRSVDEALHHIGFGRFQSVLLLCTGLAYFGDAVEVMLLSYLGPTLRCQWELGTNAESWLTSVVFAGMMIGSALWSALSDMHGRKIAVTSMAAFTGVFGLLSAAAPNFKIILFSRFFVGVGLAGVPAVFTLLMECVPPASRGFWMTSIESFWTLGTVVEAGLAALILPHHGWRMLLVVSAIPIGVLAFLCVALPESPRYLLVKGRVAEAERLLTHAATLNGKAAQLPPLDLQLIDSLPISKNSSPSPSPTSQSLTPTTAPTSPDGPNSPHQPLLHHHHHHSHHPHPSHQTGQDPNALAGGTVTLPHSFTTPPHTTPQPLHSSPRVLAPHSTTRSHARSYGPFQPSSPLQLVGSVAKPALQQAVLLYRTVSRLFRGGLQHRTLLLMVVWFTNGLAYYAVVLLSTSLLADEDAQSETVQCKGGKAPFSTQDFITILITSAAELPSIAFAAGVVDCMGRRWSMVMSLGLTGVALTPMAAGLASTAAIRTALLFMARLFIMASFTILWVYTPELYPAYVRTLGLGLNNTVARIGGIVAPFIAVGMVRNGQQHAAEGVIVMLCGVAAIAVWAVGVESAGRGLDVIEATEEEEQPAREEDIHSTV